MIESTEISTRVPHIFEDPDVQSIAEVYAEVFLNSASPLSADERIGELREFIEDCCDANPAFEQILVSPKNSRSRKLELLQKTVFPAASQFLSGFLKVLTDHDRIDLIRSVYEFAFKEHQIRQGKRRVTIRSAKSLPDAVVETIRQKVAERIGAEPVLQLDIDPSLIGGLVIQVGDTVYDHSLKNRLGQLQSRMKQRYVHEIQSGRNRFSHSEGS